MSTLMTINDQLDDEPSPRLPEHTIVALDDESAPAPAQTPAELPQRRLTAVERLQVSVWVVEGLTNAQIQELMASHGMPAITPSGLTRYRHNEELLEQAKAYLRRELTTVGLADKAVRVRKLQRHAEKLEAIIEERGFMEVTTKVTGYDRTQGGALTTTEEKFSTGLSQEYRNTLLQIGKEIEPLESAVVPQQVNNYFVNLPEADQRQIVDAMSWMPKLLPSVVIEPVEVEGESLELPPLELDHTSSDDA